jgi:hypothetical protein
MPLELVNGPVILAGESLSDYIDVRLGRIVAITMPATWEPNTQPLTFQISTDGINFNDLYRMDGIEVGVSVTKGAAILIDDDRLTSVAFIKFRSGSAAAPIAQTGDREFSITLER